MISLINQRESFHFLCKRELVVLVALPWEIDRNSQKMELEKNNNKRPCLKYELEDVKIASRELEDNHRVNIERS